VLGAIAQCDSIHEGHHAAVDAGYITSQDYDANFIEMLGDMRVSLRQTLDTVLSQAMAREVVHGIYVARTAAVKIDDALRGWMVSKGPDFPILTTPLNLPMVDIDSNLLRHIHRNAVSNAVKYGRKGGRVSTEVEVCDHQLFLRVINEPGEGHSYLCNLDPTRVFEKGARFHEANQSDVIDSKGDGAWIMRKCAECLLGKCRYTFEQHRTVFELRCPAPERFDEAEFEQLPMGDNIWGVGVDDCGFQRMVLENIFKQVGLPKSHISVVGEGPAVIEGLSDWLVELLRAKLPPHGRLLAIVDENLELLDANVTISGSHCVKRARQRLTPAEEGRLLVLIRSANDSASDVQTYCERAHGFISKAPAEPDWRVIKRLWFRRFGASRNLVVDENDTSASVAEVSLKAATAELNKVIRLIDGAADMDWAEMRRWLHRIKGTVCTVKVHFSQPALALSEDLVATIERLRLCSAAPADLMTDDPQVGDWAGIKQKLLCLVECHA